VDLTADELEACLSSLASASRSAKFLNAGASADVSDAVDEISIRRAEVAEKLTTGEELDVEDKEVLGGALLKMRSTLSQIGTGRAQWAIVRLDDLIERLGGYSS
jgi:hypothetical protein